MPRRNLIQVRRGTSAQWAAADAASDDDPDRLLAAGEPGRDIDTGELKIGDGATKFAELRGYLDEPALRTEIEASAGGRFSVRKYGAVGDDSANDTTSFAAAITAADGAWVDVPAGVYSLANLVIAGSTSIARLRLDEGAVLRQRAGTLAMINYTTGTDLTITGGTLDGNHPAMTGVAYSIVAAVPSRSQIVLHRVRLINGAQSHLRVSNFGGLLEVSDCDVTGQKEHDGTSTGQTNIIQVVGGQKDAKGLLRFNHNRCVGTTAAEIDGGNPGGVFFACNGYDPAAGGTSGSVGFANGNQSTFEAIGNYFYGYGQHAGPHDISPLHCYPTVAGARFIGNFFEACGFSAISAKSVQDFVCQGNVILNGLTSTKNTAQEGAILYGPGYQASTTQRPRAIISGNVVTMPGGEPTVGQTCISVMGTPTSRATDVIVGNNVLTTLGAGINIQNVEDVQVTGNVIRTEEGGAANTAPGIRASHVYGDLAIRGNDIKAWSDAIVALTNTTAGRFLIEDNLLKVEGVSRVGTNLRGMGFLKVTGNTIDNPGGPAVTIQGNGTTGIGKLIFDRTNRVLAGAVNLNWPDIAMFEGQELLSGNPSILAGPAAGTSAAVAVTGDGDKGLIQITTGADTVLGGLATITLAKSRRAAPIVILTPANAAAADNRSRTTVVPHTSTRAGTFVLSVGINRLIDSTVYAWYYQVI